MPSLFEGLPLTGVEAQASKLRCFFSDVITNEVKITNNIKFIPLSETPKKWAELMLKEAYYNRDAVKIENDRFNIINLSKELQQKYIKFNESSENFGKK